MGMVLFSPTHDPTRLILLFGHVMPIPVDNTGQLFLYDLDFDPVQVIQ